MANITVSLPGIMRSAGTSTASFVASPQPYATMAGTSTATWGGVFYSGGGTIVDAGTSTASFVNSSTYPVSDLLGNLGFDDTNANFSTNTYTYTGLRPWYIIEPSRFGFYSGGRNGVLPVDGRPASTTRNMIYDLGTYPTLGATDAEIRQTGSLLESGYTASQIDAGEVYFSFWGYTADESIDATPNQARVIIEYLDASETFISNALDTGWYAHSVSDTWEQYSVVNNNIPSGTRYVRVRLFARNNNLSSNYNFGAGIYFDGMRYEVMTDASDVQMIANGSFENGDTPTSSSTGTTTTGPFDWSRVTGSSLCYFWSAPNGLSPQDGQRYIQGATTNLELRQDVTLLDRYAGLLTGTDIDAETVTFDFSGYMANSAASDTGRILVEFRDSGGTVISTAYDTGTIEITPTLTWTLQSASAVDVPANTRIISFRLFANLVAGSYANVNFDNLTASLTITPIPALTATGTAAASFSGQDATPTAPLTVAGTSAASFDAGTIASADLGVSGTSTMTFYDAYNGNATMTTVGTSTVAFDVPPVGAMTSAGTSTMSFKNKTTDGTLTEAGTSTASFSGSQANTNAIMRVYITDSAEPSLDSHGRPVHESTGLKTLIWGAQLEAGRLRPSSYIPTSWDGTGGSRSGDVYNTPLTNVPWDETQATLYVEAYQYDALASGSLGSENTGPAFGVDSGGDDVHFLRSDTSGDLRYEIINNGTVEASIDGGTWTLDTAFELASSATTNDARLVVDGGSAVSDVSLTMPTIPQSGSLVVFGHSDDGTYSFDGILKRALLVPATSTTAELQVLGDPEPTPNLRFIEKLNLRSEAIGSTITKMADAGVFVEGPVSSITATWLAERTDLVGWGTKVSDGLTYPLTGLSATTAGVISLGGSYSNVFVGLGYTAKYKTGKLAHGAFGGTALLQRKRLGELSLLMQNVHRDAVSFGADFDTLRKMSLIKDGRLQSATTVYTIHDEIGFSLPGYWDTDSRICLQVAAPYPCTFLGLVISVETNERGL